MIDAVITWVDGSDDSHKAKLSHYAAAEPGVGCQEAEPTRYANNEEVYYCIHSIRKFAPFIGKIHLVTDNQQPAWLTEQKQRELGIVVVDHKLLFAGYEEFLPTFNSNSIETMLYNIPELSDRFVYFNDDFVLWQPCDAAFFFNRNQALYRGGWFWSVRLMQKAVRLFKLKERLVHRHFADVGYVGYRNEEEYFRKSRYRLYRLTHAPYPLVKAKMSELFRGPSLKKQISYRFRNDNQYWPVSIAANLALIDGTGVGAPRASGYLSCEGLTEEATRLWFKQFNSLDWVKTICIQSLDQAEPAVIKTIRSYLDERIL